MFNVSQHNAVTVIEFANGKVNAMNLEFCLQLGELIDQSSADSSRALMIEGNGRVFSAGVDLKRLISEDLDYLDQFMDALTGLFEKMFYFSKPLVASVNGHAVAGGCIMACAADAKIAHSKARIGVPELRVGVPFPSLALEIMRFTAAPHYFRQMVNIGATFSGEAAIASGLADEIIEPDQMRERGLALANELATVPPRVFALTKQQLRLPATRNIEHGEQLYRDQIIALWRSDEVRNVVRTYIEATL